MSGEKTLNECPSLNSLVKMDKGQAIYPNSEYSSFLSEVESSLEDNMEVENIKPDDVYTSNLLAVVDGSGNTVAEEAAREWLMYEGGNGDK